MKLTRPGRLRSLAAYPQCSVDVRSGVRRTEFRPQCPELLSSTRGTQVGSRPSYLPPQQCLGQQQGALQLGRRHRQARHGTWLRTGPPRSSARRMAVTCGLSMVPTISAWAASGEGASLSSEAHSGVPVGRSVRGFLMSGYAQHAPGVARVGLRYPCRATSWRTIWSATARPSLIGLATRKARRAPPNNAMQLTKPAQATELRS
jgi:hypothetical protein